MLRLFPLGLVLVGLAAGLQRQWLVIDWTRLLTDLGVNVSEGDQPIDFISGSSAIRSRIKRFA